MECGDVPSSGNVASRGKLRGDRIFRIGSRGGPARRVAVRPRRASRRRRSLPGAGRPARLLGLLPRSFRLDARCERVHRRLRWSVLHLAFATSSSRSSTRTAAERRPTTRTTSAATSAPACRTCARRSPGRSSGGTLTGRRSRAITSARPRRRPARACTGAAASWRLSAPCGTSSGSARSPSLDRRPVACPRRQAVRERRERPPVPTGRRAPVLEPYHDLEWGVPVHDDRRHFEFLVLESAQAGLSWLTILKRRGGVSPRLFDFDPAAVAELGPTDVERLLADAGIIRNRAKIESTISNARAFLEIRSEFGSFDSYIWGFVGGTPLVEQLGPGLADPSRDGVVEGGGRGSAAEGIWFPRAGRCATPTFRRPARQRPHHELLPSGAGACRPPVVGVPRSAGAGRSARAARNGP